MKKINSFWIDNNGNKWNSISFTEEQAEKNSNSLIDCRHCQDCQNCRDCQYCYDCRHCQNCYNCRHCQDCQNCRDCQYCQNCWDCQYCYDCRHCRDCRHCQNWKTNPQKIISDNIGSRNDQTTVYFDKERTEVVCGCFRGTLEEFAEIVVKKHGNNEFGKQYQKFIAKVIAYRS